MNLVRATGTIGGLTLISRVLGFARDVLFARFVGAGLASDCFLIAFRLPNLFRALFAEGAFSAAFVPMFSRTLGPGRGDGTGGDLAAGRVFAEQVLSVLLPVLAGFTILMVALAGPVVWAMTGGFPDASPEKYRLAVEFTRITFPYLLLISLVSLLGGILNSIGRFWVNAAAPILLNLALIAGLTLFHGATPVESARVQSAAVTVAGILQFVWLLWACHRAGINLRLTWPRLTPPVRALLRVIGPAALGSGAVQFNLLISTALAARFLGEGAISYLYYADRLNQLPLGLIGIGIGTVLLPTLSRQLAGGLEAQAMHTQNRAIELVLLLTLPSAAALVVSAGPIIHTLLEHGRFTATASVATAGALATFSLGLPAYVLIKVLTPGFYARSDTKTPVRIAVASMLVNLVGNIALIWPLGILGIALSTAIAAWVNAGLLYLTLHRRRHFSVDHRLRKNAWRLVAASAVMAAVLLVADRLVAPWMTGSLVERGVALALLIAGGGIAYVVAAYLLRAFSLADLKSQLRRAPK
ncbi:murein biosynthesis integral membrane protein MurJ [Polymorphobacter sp. PAMC 29334]|uniref:murein biosynthesis integral membrane protein MurJ n=1 Tax=Polymorphobacter sp. PAMC 29334 TaxID=2862331 RepID=UPI001C75755B|nr:murein biosynthesis integral membrane protein MurJ [Polymorphobacter sp. PAMC 29334]QYE35906.1 murein biosynthesis integral membrane protein MurJ [Polymorphobacter sp. PAMC 29334]